VSYVIREGLDGQGKWHAGREEKYVQDFGANAWRKEPMWMTV